jgi:hypothetical protein
MTRVQSCAHCVRRERETYRAFRHERLERIGGERGLVDARRQLGRLGRHEVVGGRVVVVGVLGCVGVRERRRGGGGGGGVGFGRRAVDVDVPMMLVVLDELPDLLGFGDVHRQLLAAIVDGLVGAGDEQRLADVVVAARARKVQRCVVVAIPGGDGVAKLVVDDPLHERQIAVLGGIVHQRAVFDRSKRAQYRFQSVILGHFEGVLTTRVLFSLTGAIQATRSVSNTTSSLTHRIGF